MYYNFFGLNQPPYRITPDTMLFYSGSERGAVLDALEYAIVNGEGITKVVGEVGSGKTMLLRMLASRLPESVQLVYLPNPSIEAENILETLAFEMDLKIDPAANRLHVMRALQDYLLKKHTENKQVVIFIEEAQAIPLETLEEIRLLSNLETQHHKLLQVVLFGQPELDENLATPNVRQIKERITNSFYLTPLKNRDIRDYLMFRLRTAGYNGAEVFSPAAIRLLAYTSKGLMRRINILADKAMLAAFSSNTRQVSLKHVWAALKDSEFGQAYAKFRTVTLSCVVLIIFAAAAWLINSHYPLIPKPMNLSLSPATAVISTTTQNESRVHNELQQSASPQ